MRPPDRLFSQYIRQRDEHCLNCGTNRNLQCAHILGRRFSAIRCDPDNAVTLCLECHHFFDSNPKAWRVWVDERYPGRRETLRERATPVRPDWKPIAAWLRQQTKETT